MDFSRFNQDTSMKGQMVFEFIVAAMVFFIIVVYVINFWNAKVGDFTKDSRDIDMETGAGQISELLVKEQGLWDGRTPRIVGIASDNGWPEMNITRIEYLKDYCTTDYEDLKNKLELGGGSGDFNLLIKTAAGEFGCGPSVPSVSNIRVRRIGMDSDKRPLVVDLWLW